MNNTERVIRYLEGDMTPSEKKKFEAELLVSEDLKRETGLYHKLRNNIDEVKNIPTDPGYTASIISRFRAKQTSSRRKYYPAYAAITAIAALILLFFNLTRQPDAIKIDNTALAEKADSVIIDLADIEGGIDSVVTSNDEYNAAIDEMLLKELNVTAEELDSIYYANYGSSQNLSEISDEESQIVYDEIINKSFF